MIKKSGEQQGSTTRIPQQQQQQSTKAQIQEVQKPATLDFNDKRKKTQNFKEIVQTTPTTSSFTGSPKLARHQKVRDLEGSRTPSPSSVSRKSSFASLFKVHIARRKILSFIIFWCKKRFVIFIEQSFVKKK